MVKTGLHNWQSSENKRNNELLHSSTNSSKRYGYNNDETGGDEINILSRLWRQIVTGSNKDMKSSQAISININMQGGIDMIYDLLKQMISTGNFPSGDLTNKLNVFFAVGQITQEQYAELMGMLNHKVIPTA